jgi:hypothetical protein
VWVILGCLPGRQALLTPRLSLGVDTLLLTGERHHTGQRTLLLLLLLGRSFSTAARLLLLL